MNKGIAILVAGLVLIGIAVGIFALATRNVEYMNKVIYIGPNSTKNIDYNLEKDTYILAIHSDIPVDYSLSNSSGVVIHEENITQSNKTLNELQGKYTLKIINPNNSTAEVNLIFKNQESLLSLSTYILGSAGICLTGIIVVIVGIILALKGRKKEDIENVS